MILRLFEKLRRMKRLCKHEIKNDNFNYTVRSVFLSHRTHVHFFRFDWSKLTCVTMDGHAQFSIKYRFTTVTVLHTDAFIQISFSFHDRKGSIFKI